QFAQLIGYSLSGFGDLSYVSDETYAAASSMANIDEKLINALASLRKYELGITETAHIIYVLTAVGVPVDLDRLLVWIRQNFRFPLLDVDDDESWQEFCEHFKERVRNGR
ncbi:MAG TPA: hypothetical protein V6C65_24625, partial [Allocoleopsis sp.]